MNKAITDGIVFTPPPFANGLDVWSRGNGTPGSDTYDTAANAAFVPADPDFGGALELLKTQSVQRLRYMGETPLLPGCYLQIKARVKAISGALPSVRIAAFAGRADGSAVPGAQLTGPSQALTTYGAVVEVSAIVGIGDRTGVHMVWGSEALYGHFGLDLTGANGGVVRIDDIEITDITSAFLRDMMSLVDVRDYGAVGDGTTDDHAAFVAADAAADGREVLIPEGTYFLGDSMTFQNRTRFQGNVTMAASSILSLTKNFHMPAYIDAFGNDELAFKKAYQALLNNSGHDSLDLGGRLLTINNPIDMAEAVNNRTTYKIRRIIRNGQFSYAPGSNWDTEVYTSQATYSPDNPKELTNVVNVANIPVGSLIEGNGVGREVYVFRKNVGQGTITLSAPLHDADGTQVFTFRRFKYILDFSGFDQISKFSMSDIEIQCSGQCSAILLPPTGTGFHLRDSFITRPKDRGITSHGEGDQGMMIDRCQFLSDESPLASTARVSIGLNTNANDVKLRNNRVVHFRHFAVIGGSSSIITGNHIFQGDSTQNAVRMPALVLTRVNNRGTITGNYIDNAFIEWTNETEQFPTRQSGFSFSALSLTNNVFLASNTIPSFKYIVVKPYGGGHFINGLTVTGNTFRMIAVNIDRVEGIDTSFATMDYDRFRNVRFADNAFNNISLRSMNPMVLDYEEESPQEIWDVDFNDTLPFAGFAQTVESILAKGPIRDANNDNYWGMPYYLAKQGPQNRRVRLFWERPVRGTMTMRVRMDNPV